MSSSSEQAPLGGKGASAEGRAEREHDTYFDTPGWVLDAGVLLLLVGLCLLFFLPVLFPTALREAFPSGDFSEQFYPYRRFASYELLAGRFPLWTPFANGGHPFFADSQAALLYPPNLILTLVQYLAGVRDLPLLWLEWMAVLHVMLAGVTMFFCARHLTRSRAGAFVSAFIFAFGGYLTSYPMQQLAILESIAWLPLLLLLVTLAVERRGIAYWTLAALVLAIAILAGHPQTVLHMGYLLLAYTLVRIVQQWRTTGAAGSTRARLRAALGPIGGLVLLFALACGLSLVQLLPSYELARFSARAHVEYGFVQSGFHPREVAGLLLPDLQGGKPMYVGLVGLALAGIGVACWRRRGVRFWAIAAALSFLLSFGGSTPLFRAAYYVVPGLSAFRDQERFIAITSLSLAILAGYGARRLTEANDEGRRFLAARVMWGAWVLCGLIALAFLLVSMTDGLSAWLVAHGLLAAGSNLALPTLLFGAMLLLALIAAVFTSTARGAIDGQWSVILAALLLIMDLFFVNIRNNVQGHQSEELYPQTPAVQALRERVALGSIEVENGLPSYAGYVYRLPILRSISPLMTRYFAEALQHADFWRLGQLLNVRSVVTPRDLSQDLGKPLYDDGQTRIYQPEYPSQQAHIAYNALVEPRDASQLELLMGQGEGAGGKPFVYGRDVVVSASPAVQVDGNGHTRRILVERKNFRHWVIESEGNRPGILVLSQVYYPGWQAYIDGKPAQAERVDYLLIGVPVPPGPHLVEFIYNPLSFRLGVVLSLAALGLLVGLLLLALARRWGRRSGSREGRRRARGVRLALLALPLLAGLGSGLLAQNAATAHPGGTSMADMQALTRYLQAEARSGDLVLLPARMAPGQLHLPDGVETREATETDSATFPRGYRTVWLIAAPGAAEASRLAAERWQGQNERKSDEAWFGELYLGHYEANDDLLASLNAPLNALLSAQVWLLGARMVDEQGNLLPGELRRDAQTLTATLAWRSEADRLPSYHVSFQLVNDQGVLVDQDDSIPAQGTRPTDGWAPRELIVDQHTLSLPGALPSGTYRLIAVVYDPVTMSRLAAADGTDHVELGNVVVEP